MLKQDNSVVLASIFSKLTLEHFRSQLLSQSDPLKVGRDLTTVGVEGEFSAVRSLGPSCLTVSFPYGSLREMCAQEQWE